MIDSEKIEQKLKPLNDRIETINLKLGSELANELLSRIEITISSFFEEFKSLSSKSLYIDFVILKYRSSPNLLFPGL